MVDVARMIKTFPHRKKEGAAAISAAAEMILAAAWDEAAKAPQPDIESGKATLDAFDTADQRWREFARGVNRKKSGSANIAGMESYLRENEPETYKAWKVRKASMQ